MKQKFISNLILGTMISTMICTLVPVKASAEWVTDYQNNFYYKQNNKNLTGWKRIDGQLYYFDDNGKMQTGWIKADSSWYFLQNNGALKTGWIKYNNKLYYADSSGAMQTGIIDIEGKIYILDDNGVMKTSNTVINGQFYTIGLDGVVAGSKVPTPDKEFDSSGNYIKVLKNTDSNVITSPTDSSFNEVIEDESEDNADEEEYYNVKYTLTYKDSDGSKLKAKTVNKGKSVELYEPSKDGYNFTGWDTQLDGSGKSYDEGDDVKINKDLTLYAQWEKDTTVYAESISITGSSNVVINKTTQMTATVSPSNAANTSVTWSVTSGTGSATIDSDGLLTGVSSGTVTVKATAKDGSGITATKEVTVGETEVVVPVTSISVTSSTGVSKITTSGGTLQMSASLSPTTATNQEITWSVVDRTGSATISDTGLLTAVSNGTVTVEATANDGSGVIGSKTITISGQSATVSVESITVNGKNSATTIATDSGTLQMSATVSPSSASNATITWSVETASDSGSSMTGNATISSGGLLTALADGTVLVKATAKDGTGVVGSKEITISNQIAKVTKIIVTGENNVNQITTSSAATLQMEAAISPDSAIDKGITWSVEQAGDAGTAMTGKATISSSGLLTAVSNGTVKVIATSTNGTGVYGSEVITISGQPTKVTAIVISTTNNVSELVTNSGTNLTLQMYATITPSTATDKTVIWSVTNKTGSATIDQNGLLTAETNGTVLVTVTANDGSGISRSKLITISGQIVDVTAITVVGEDSFETITLDKGTLQMNATITPSAATNKVVTWLVSNKDGTTELYATIDSSTGLLTAVSNGTVVVTATSTDGTSVVGTREITISGQIIKVAGISVAATANANVVAVKGTLQMSATVSPNNATNTAVTWSVSNTAYATINTDGVLTGVSAGTVTVTATAKDGSGTSGTSATIFVE